MSPGADAQGSARRGAWLVVALGALSAFGPLCLDMYLPALPQLPGDLSSTAGAAQLSLTSCIVGLALGQLLVGPLSDRVGRRRPLLVGVAVFALASALCAVTGSMPLLIVLRFVQGAAGAAGIVVGRAIVADLFAGRAAAAYFSTMAAINGLAPILAPVIGAQVLRVGTWRTVFWVLAGVGIVLWLLTLLVVGRLSRRNVVRSMDFRVCSGPSGRYWPTGCIWGTWWPGPRLRQRCSATSRRRRSSSRTASA